MVTSLSGQENPSHVHTSVHIVHELHYFSINKIAKEEKVIIAQKFSLQHSAGAILYFPFIFFPISVLFLKTSPLLPHVHRPRLPALDQYPLQSDTFSLSTMLMQIWASSVSWRAVSPSPLVTNTGTHARVRSGSASCDSPKLTLFCH